jgi:hypothetical protein
MVAAAVDPAVGAMLALTACLLMLLALDDRSARRRKDRPGGEVSAHAAEGIVQLERWLDSAYQHPASGTHAGRGCAGSCLQRFRRATLE